MLEETQETFRATRTEMLLLEASGDLLYGTVIFLQFFSNFSTIFASGHFLTAIPPHRGRHHGLTPR
jgi:hypothetical protein